jgi:hypothetical protein
MIRVCYKKPARGGNILGVAQRAVTLAKLTTALSGALTVSCAVTLAALQVAAGLMDGVWEPHRLSWIVASLKNDKSLSYYTASVKDTQLPMMDWLLGIPAIPLLAMVALVHFAFYCYLVEFEKRRSRRSHL